MGALECPTGFCVSMALTTYAGLIAEIWADLDKTQVTNLAENWIAAAEARFNSALRVRQMLQRDTATIADALSLVPGDFLAVRQMRMVASPYTLLKYLTQEQMAAFRATSPSGDLAYYSLVGGQFEYAPTPATGVSVVLTYYQQIPTLSVSATTNWMLAFYPLAYKRAALVEAGLYYRDNELIVANEGALQRELEMIKLNSREADAFNLTPIASAQVV